MKKLINEAKRMQQLAGLLKEDFTSQTPDSDDYSEFKVDSEEQYDEINDEILSKLTTVEKEEVLAQLDPAISRAKRKYISDNLDEIPFFEIEKYFPNQKQIYTIEVGGEYVDNIYVYDIGGGIVGITDDYSNMTTYSPKVEFEKAKAAIEAL